MTYLYTKILHCTERGILGTIKYYRTKGGDIIEVFTPCR